jgi:hypothetical protein
MISELALAAVGEANRVWAAVLTDPARPVADLARVYAGARLSQATSDIERMRNSGQYRAARLAAPLTVRSVQELNRFRIDTVVSEVWEDRLHNADGSVVRDLSGPVERRYALELRFEPCYCWFVVEQT